MSVRRSVSTNVLWNWASHGLSVLIGFYVIRLLLDRLGADVFGTWLLLSSILGYYGLLNLGFDSSVVRYVSKFKAEDRTEDLRSVLGAAQRLFALIALGISLLGVVLGVSFLYFDAVFGLFSIPHALRNEFAGLVVILSLGAASSFLSRTHVAVLRAMDRWDLVNRITMLNLLLRTVVLVALMGRSLLALGCIYAFFNAFSALLTIRAASRVLPDCRFGFGIWNRRSAGLVGRYGGVASANQLADLVRFQTDAFVIAHFLPIQLLTFYSFGFKLLEYLRHFMGNVAWPLFPLFSRLESRAEGKQAQETFLRASRIVAFLSALAAGSLIGSGRTFLSFWVGPKAGATGIEIAYTVLLILIVPITVEMILSVGGIYLFGTGRHHDLAKLNGIEAAANLVLSVLLAPIWGVVGVALGTALPMMIIKTVFLPRLVCRHLAISWGYFLLRTLAPAIALSGLLGLSQWELHSLLRLPALTTLLFVTPLSVLAAATATYTLFFPGPDRSFHRQVLKRHWAGWLASSPSKRSGVETASS